MRRWIIAAGMAVTASAALTGCYNPGTPLAGRWLDPFGWTSKNDLGEQPAFQKQVNKDPFPSASQVGVASKTQKKPEK
jgi:hypothetical protein